MAGSRDPSKFRLDSCLKEEARSIHAGRPGKTRICRRRLVKEGATSRQAPQWTHPPAVVRARDPPIASPRKTRDCSRQEGACRLGQACAEGEGGSKLPANQWPSVTRYIPAFRKPGTTFAPKPGRGMAHSVQTTTPHILHAHYSPHDQGTSGRPRPLRDGQDRTDCSSSPISHSRHANLAIFGCLSTPVSSFSQPAPLPGGS